MRAPFQILAIPYKYIDGILMFCVLHRSDFDQWHSAGQFVGNYDKCNSEDEIIQIIKTGANV